MRKLVVLALLALFALGLLPAVASAKALVPYTVVGMEWNVTQGDGKWSHARYSYVRFSWGIVVDTDPVYTHDFGEDYYLNLPTNMGVYRHCATAPKWRLVTAWDLTTRVALPPTSAVSNSSSFKAKWKPGSYKYRLTVTEPSSSRRLSWGNTFGIN